MASAANSPLKGLASRLLEQPCLREVIEILEQGRSTTVDGAWGSSAPLAVSSLIQKAPSTIVVVVPRERELDEFAADLASFGVALPSQAGGDQLLILPAWASLPNELSITGPILGSRLGVLRAFESKAPPRVVVATISALLQQAPNRTERAVASRWCDCTARAEGRPSTQDGRKLWRYRHRWPVERTNAWLQDFRRVLVSHDYELRDVFGIRASRPHVHQAQDAAFAF